jgi:agmatine deiminase
MSATLNSLPAHDRFAMPAEYSPHEGCWLFWPERCDNWRDCAKPAQKTFAKIATAIAQFEPVTVAASEKQFKNARLCLPPSVRVVEIASNDAWARDIGPTFVLDGKGNMRGVDWRFNAWGGLNGGLYFPWDLDDLAAEKILELEKIDRYRADFVMEGGAIHVDGEGTLLATEECLLNVNRNPTLSKMQIEQNLRDYCGVEKIIWVKRGVVGDETDGHIDNICAFARPGVVALNWTEDRSDPQFEVSNEAFESLSLETDARGRKLTIVKIAQPKALVISKEESDGIDGSEGTVPRRAGDRLTATYINFYIANGGIIAPTFDDPQDALALSQLAELFPDRKIVGIPAREVILGGGGIHCITQQQPKRSP